MSKLSEWIESNRLSNVIERTRQRDLAPRWRGFGYFAPKCTDNIRPPLAPLCGLCFEFEWCGRAGDDEPYPRQNRWLIVHPSKVTSHELHQNQLGYWIPEEDIRWVERAPPGPVFVLLGAHYDTWEER
jgi:hypothetical protein